MGVAYNTSVVLDGLVAYLDAANPKSYSGSGTTWGDISNSGNTGTLVNSPTYIAGNNAAFQFVAGKSVSFASNTNIQFLGTLPYTIQTWVYVTAQPPTTSWLRILDRENDPGTGRDGYNMLINTSSGTTVEVTTERWSSGVFSGSTTLVDASTIVNNWLFITASYNSASLFLNINGVQKAQTTSSGNITNTTRTLGIARNGISANISTVSIYNRALTITEINQNFNALRGRYGI